MVRYCCVPLCKSHSKRSKYVMYHSIPKITHVRERWLERIKASGIESTRTCEGTSARVCSLHFRAKDYIWTVKLGELKRNLKSGAVPSLFPWSEEWVAERHMDHFLAEHILNVAENPGPGESRPVDAVESGEGGNSDTVLIKKEDCENSPKSLVKVLTPKVNVSKGKSLELFHTFRNFKRTNRTFCKSKHMKVGSSEVVKCNKCDYQTNAHYHLARHSENHYKNGKYKCRFCSYSVNKEVNVFFHEENHHKALQVEKRFQCNFCSFKSNVKRVIADHEREVHGANTTLHQISVDSHGTKGTVPGTNNSICCPHCTFQTSSYQQYHHHMITHSGSDVVENEESSNFDQCNGGKGSGEESNDMETCALSSKSSTSPKWKKPEGKLVEKSVYQCPYCPYWARTLAYFHDHFASHLKTQPYKCSHCDFRGNYRSNIRRHLNRRRAYSDHFGAHVIILDRPVVGQYDTYMTRGLVPINEYHGRFLKQTSGASDSVESSAPTTLDSIQAANDPPMVRLNLGSLEDEATASADNNDSSSTWDLSIKDPLGDSPNDIDVHEIYFEENHYDAEDPTILEKSREVIDLGSSPTNDAEGTISVENTLEVGEQDQKEQKSGPLVHFPEPTIDGNLEEEEFKCRSQINQCRDYVRQTQVEIRKLIVAEQQTLQLCKHSEIEVTSLKSKLRYLREKESSVASELSRFRQRKEELTQIIADRNGEKIRAELIVRTCQCDLLKLRLSSLNYDDSNLKMTQEIITNKEIQVQKAEQELEQIEQQILSYESEQRKIDPQIETTETALLKLSKAADMLNGNLATLESTLTINRDLLQRIRSELEGWKAKQRSNIRSFVELEKNLLKISYLKTLKNLNNKEDEWMRTLNLVENNQPMPLIDVSSTPATSVSIPESVAYCNGTVN